MLARTPAVKLRGIDLLWIAELIEHVWGVGVGVSGPVARIPPLLQRARTHARSKRSAIHSTR